MNKKSTAPKTRKNPIQEALGKILREKRVALGLSQEELAERAELHFTYVSSTERGERNISLINIARLARGLDCSMKDLMPH